MLNLNEPKDLYRIIHDTYKEYVKNPTERDFLFLVLGLTHLREWISENNHKGIKDKEKRCEQLTEGEKFFEEIYSIHSFQVIQGLCNKTKHYVTKKAPAETAKLGGLRAGISRAGDKVDQVNFLIDGKDSRDYFIDLIHKYNEWFSHHG